MESSDRDTDAIDLFKKHIATWEAAYSNVGLSYHAVRDGSRLTIMHARLFLHVSPTGVPNRAVKFLDQEVGYLTLNELRLGIWEIIERFTQGETLETPNGQIVFPIDDNQIVRISLQTLHEEGLPSSRLSLLTLTGARLHRERFSLDIDWSLKANDPPYDGMMELLTQYRLGRYNGEFAYLEVPAVHIAELDYDSPVSGEVAEPSVFFPNALDPSFLSLGILIYKGEGVVERLLISGDDLIWSEIESSTSQKYGRGRVDIPLGAAIKCFVSYQGVTQHERWIADPGLFPNWRRTTYEWADRGCEALRDFLFEEKKPRKDSLDFEVGVAGLLWMLGFGVFHLETKRLKDNPDLIVTTQGGRMALVECTIGVIDTDDKLAKLLSRSRSLKDQLSKSGSAHVDLLPILVTALPADQVMDIEKATKFGIVVLTKETLSSVLERTVFSQDSDTFFQEQVQALQKMQGQ